MKNSKKIAYGGIISALSLALMFLSTLFPFFDYAPALSGLVLIALLFEFGKKASITAYAAVAILSFLIVPNKESAVLFTAFFGYYPIIKSSFEHMKSRAGEWILKILLFNTAAVVGYSIIIFVFGITELLTELGGRLWYLAVLWLLANIAFVLYDIAISRLAFFYQKKILPTIHRAIGL